MVVIGLVLSSLLRFHLVIFRCGWPCKRGNRSALDLEEWVDRILHITLFAVGGEMVSRCLVDPGLVGW